MRGPERIDVILQELAVFWKANPDWRLGQLIVNVIGPAAPCPLIFYAEDDRFITHLREFSERQQRARNGA